MADEVDVLVIGAGLMGAAAAWSAARRGLSVTVLEQFEPHHAQGSSHGSARIVRRVYGDELYVRLTGRAFELWREVEAGSGASLLRMLGGLDFGPRRDVRAAAALLSDAEVEHELLDATEAAARWDGLRFEGPVLFHPQAGTLDSTAACTALLSLATRTGADLRYSTAVRAIEPAADSARVVLAHGVALTARCVVVAAGAWAAPLLAGLVALPALTVTQQSVFHFPRVNPAAEPWPSVIHEDAQAMYHLAGGRDGGAGDDRKVGEHDRGRGVRADDRDGVVDPAARERVTEYVRRWLPGLEPTPRGECTCLYTVTPSEDFLLDRVGPIVVCSPCSGHGAKFAPLIGELTAGLVTGEAAVPDRFRLAAHAAGNRRSVSL